MQNFPIYISSRRPDQLIYIGHGYEDAAYLDPKLKLLVKIPKSKDQFEPYLWFSQTIAHGQVHRYKSLNPKLKQMYNSDILKAMMIYQVTHDLKSFIQIKGFIIYPNILSAKVRDKTKAKIVASIATEYYPISTIQFGQINQSYRNVIKDFYKLNTRGYYHSNLNDVTLIGRCRNIFSYKDRYKVIDIQTIRPMFKSSIIPIESVFKNPFADLYGLIYCLANRAMIKLTYAEALRIQINRKLTEKIQQMNHNHKLIYKDQSVYIKVSDIKNFLLKLIYQAYRALITKFDQLLTKGPFYYQKYKKLKTQYLILDAINN